MGSVIKERKSADVTPGCLLRLMQRCICKQDPDIVPSMIFSAAPTLYCRRKYFFRNSTTAFNIPEMGNSFVPSEFPISGLNKKHFYFILFLEVEAVKLRLY